MTSQANNILAAFNSLINSLNPGAGTAVDMLSAVNLLADALTTFVNSNTFSTAFSNGIVTAPKIASAAFRLLVFTGVDASGAPALATLTGSKVGDVVIGVVSLTDSAIATSSFESTITTIDKINQLNTNLSTKKFFAILIAKGG